ncbi:ankyrin repeat-containing domain protein [Apiospora phragmitis]|uniref:protein S-acyltransferase n=1 Tax=Apiospora phragmitis TaxID=2905665 RepID=A0ABR1X7J6_9PEZI
MATGIEVVGAVAACIEIAKFSKSLTGLISDITKGTAEIEHTLLHFKATIEGVAAVFENVQKTIKDQEVTDSDSLVIIVSDSGQHCAGLLKRLQGQLPELSEDAGVKQKVRATLTKKINGKAIQEQVGFLRHRQISRIDAKIDGMRSVLLELPAAPPYSLGSLEDYDYDRLRGTTDKFREAATRETSVCDLDLESASGRKDEVRLSSTGLDELPSEIRKLLIEEPPPTPPQQDTVKDLEARGMLLKAASVDCLPPLTHDEEMEHEERRADLLTRCATVRLQQRALGILNRLWEWESQQEDINISPERLGRLGSKLAKLSLDSQRLGHFTEKQRAEDHDRAREVLNRSTEVLMSNIRNRQTWLCVGSQKGSPSEAWKRAEGELDPLPPDWPRRFEAWNSRALAWCEPANLAGMYGRWPEKVAVVEQPDDLSSLKFNVRSPDFRFDEAAEGISPLHLAVIYEEKDIVAEMLSEVENADVGSPGPSTPLIEAARNGREDIGQLLLEHDASVECVDAKMHRTALHWAQTSERHNGVGVAKLFLNAPQAESLLEKPDIDGKTALYLACEMGNRKMVELLVDKYHAQVNVADTYGKTALHATVDAKEPLEDRLRIARILLQARAEPDTSDSRDHTPLCAASSRGHAKAVALLLEHGTDPNRPGQEGQTPLIAATQRNHAGVVLALMRKGGRPHQTDASGRSALDYARRSPTTSDINHLLRRSATSFRRKGSRMSVQSAPPPRTNSTASTAATGLSTRTSTMAGADTGPLTPSSQSFGRHSLDAVFRGSSSRRTSGS